MGLNPINSPDRGRRVQATDQHARKILFPQQRQLKRDKKNQANEYLNESRPCIFTVHKKLRLKQGEERRRIVILDKVWHGTKKFAFSRHCPSMLHSQKQLFLTDRQAVENVDESLPELNAVFSFALVVKSVDSGTKNRT